MVLSRADLSAEQALTHLVGMQGQAPQAPYIGLWSRLAGFQAEELSGLLLDRRAVRIAVMRNTVHLVTAFILSHADRTRVIARADWQTMMDSRLAPRAVLVDGYVRATWKITEQRAALEREGAALLAFATPKAQATAVRFSA